DAAVNALDRRPPDKPRNDPTARIAVQHGDLFGQPHRVVDGNDVAQDGDFGLFGDLGNDGGVEVHGRLHAPVGRVVLVGHDAVEAHLIGPGVLLMVLIV